MGSINLDGPVVAGAGEYLSDVWWCVNWWNVGWSDETLFEGDWLIVHLVCDSWIKNYFTYLDICNGMGDAGGVWLVWVTTTGHYKAAVCLDILRHVCILKYPLTNGAGCCSNITSHMTRLHHCTRMLAIFSTLTNKILVCKWQMW